MICCVCNIFSPREWMYSIVLQVQNEYITAFLSFIHHFSLSLLKVDSSGVSATSRGLPLHCGRMTDRWTNVCRINMTRPPRHTGDQQAMLWVQTSYRNTYINISEQGFENLWSRKCLSFTFFFFCNHEKLWNRTRWRTQAMFCLVWDCIISSPWDTVNEVAAKLFSLLKKKKESVINAGVTQKEEKYRRQNRERGEEKEEVERETQAERRWEMGRFVLNVFSIMP